MVFKCYIQLTIKEAIAQNPDDYEAVHTGYTDNQGREVAGEYIFHGQAQVTTCRDCGGLLKEKNMRIEKRQKSTHIVNGIARPVEVEDGRVVVLWVCTRKCAACRKNQRILPPTVRRWLRYALSIITTVLLTLFTKEELSTKAPLKGKHRRPFHQIAFYGENSTVYRWRRKSLEWMVDSE